VNYKADTIYFTDIVYSINNVCPDLVNFGLPGHNLFSHDALFSVYVNPGKPVTVCKSEFNCRYISDETL